MSKPKEETQRLMAAAADLRAGGVAWDNVARALERSERTCRRWTEEHPRLWQALLRAAERRQEREARAEARVVLRQLLRAGEEKSRITAATNLLKKSPRKRPPAKSELAEQNSELAAYIAVVRGLSDDELRAHLDVEHAPEGAALRTTAAAGPPAPG